MSLSGGVAWLGRARDAAGRDVVVRVFTAGAPPDPGDPFEEIEDPFAAGEDDPIDRALQGRPLAGGLRGTVRRASLAAPVRPTKILAVGRNFHAHAAELGNEVPKEPLLFLKPPSCLVGSGASVPLPRGFERIDLEGELVLVIGRRGRSIPAQHAWRHILGVTLGNDVSCRDLQRRDDQWTRAKGFDGFGPVGPWIRVAPGDQPLPLDRARLVSKRNGEVRQDSPLGRMIFDPAAIVAVASAVMTLEPGDLIFMGTPEGVSPLSPGDTVTIELSGEWPLAPLVTTFA